MKALAIVSISLLMVSSGIACQATAQSPPDYFSSIQNLDGSRLRQQLYKTVAWAHDNDDPSELLENCHSSQSCHFHQPLSYKNARRHLFGEIDLLTLPSEGFAIVSFYCRDTFYQDDFPNSKNLGPLRIPSSSILNTEHSWPQSKFSTSFSKSTQKTDLHALFPVRNRVNSIRGNRPFGNVESTTNRPCDEVHYGISDVGTTVFEPSDEVKGNVARALFYFSVRYQMNIDEDQENVLRSWHQLDPVDSDELLRNSMIYEIQGNRNPFIEMPHLVMQMENF